MVNPAEELLKIDALRVVEAIVTWLREVCQRGASRSVLLGLSGGVDSSLLATLVVQALGVNEVQVRYLFDRDSSKQLRYNAERMAAWLGLELRCVDIQPEMEAESIYDPVSMRITSFSGWLNRWLHRTYGWVTGETPFVSALRAGKLAVEKRDKVRGGYHLTVASTEAAFNARHRYRRKLLEAEARERDWVLIGAANRSEWLVGWYVRGGVDHLPLQPLIGLYKTQIRQLAAYLGLPEEVRRQPPSPDMRKGITDEFALGLPYWKIDLVLDYLDGGLNEVQITSVGVTQREMAHVQQMHVLSEWKRDPQPVPPPVEGTISGGYRKTLPEGIPAAWSGTGQ